MSRLFAPERLLIGPQCPAEKKAGGLAVRLQMNFCSILNDWKLSPLISLVSSLCSMRSADSRPMKTLQRWSGRIWLRAYKQNRNHLFIASLRLIGFVAEHLSSLEVAPWDLPSLNVLFILTRGFVINTGLSVRGPIYLRPDGRRWTGLQLPRGLLSRCLLANESELCKTNVL